MGMLISLSSPNGVANAVRSQLSGWTLLVSNLQNKSKTV
jgi:hypothetical protein